MNKRIAIKVFTRGCEPVNPSRLSRTGLESSHTDYVRAWNYLDKMRPLLGRLLRPTETLDSDGRPIGRT